MMRPTLGINLHNAHAPTWEAITPGLRGKVVESHLDVRCVCESLALIWRHRIEDRKHVMNHDGASADWSKFNCWSEISFVGLAQIEFDWQEGLRIVCYWFYLYFYLKLEGFEGSD